jgi:hypothetical protein
MPKKDSALILSTWRGVLDWHEVHARVQNRLTSAKSLDQIKCHARTAAQKAGGWQQALEAITTYKSGTRRFKRKCPFDARAKLAIALALRDCYHDRHRFKIVTERMKLWFRRNGVPSYIDINSTGTGPGTLHEKIKNHSRNNIDIRYNKTLETAIAAAVLEVEQEASQALPTPPADISVGPPSPSHMDVTSQHHGIATPPNISPIPHQASVALASSFGSWIVPPVTLHASPAYHIAPPVAPIVAPQPVPDPSPLSEVISPSEMTLPSQSYGELTFGEVHLSDPGHPFHQLTLAIWEGDDDYT